MRMLHVRPANTQISPCIRVVSPESSQGIQCVVKDTKRLQADNEDSDQLGSESSLGAHVNL